jgi:glycosyltransferase involved in cell wall biosynthesis
MLADARSIPLRDLQSILIRLQLPVSYSLERRLLAQATCVVAVASSVARELGDYDVDPQNVRVVGNGVDTDAFSPLPAGRAQSEMLVLSVGRLSPEKGFEDLIASARIVRAQFPSVRFLVVGKGPLEASIRKRIAVAGLEGHVELLGYIGNRAELAALFRRATLFVHPALHEGMPTVLLEAMACGRPVITTAVSGALEVIEQDRNGLLVPPREPTLMAEAIMRLLANGALREQLGRAARRTVEDKYSWKRVGQEYIQIYERMVESEASA